ncbi:MAG: DUF480 domain-containing protein [Rubrivivax sp.]
MRVLSPLEVRVLGVLVEKQCTVPDTYPLSLNALVAGCNQKTAREPIISATDADAMVAVDGLKSLSLVFEGSSTRVLKFEHNLPRVLNLKPDAAALLTALMLRGAQTSAELRSNADRLQRFTDVAAVEALLHDMAQREPARVIKLPRASGEREARWAHLLCGEPVLAASHDVATPVAADSVGAGEIAALRAEQTRLGGEVAHLRALVQRLADELGIDTRGAG